MQPANVQRITNAIDQITTANLELTMPEFLEKLYDNGISFKVSGLKGGIATSLVYMLEDESIKGTQIAANAEENLYTFNGLQKRGVEYLAKRDREAITNLQALGKEKWLASQVEDYTEAVVGDLGLEITVDLPELETLPGGSQSSQVVEAKPDLAEVEDQPDEIQDYLKALIGDLESAVMAEEAPPEVVEEIPLAIADDVQLENIEPAAIVEAEKPEESLPAADSEKPVTLQGETPGNKEQYAIDSTKFILDVLGTDKFQPKSKVAEADRYSFAQNGDGGIQILDTYQERVVLSTDGEGRVTTSDFQGNEEAKFTALFERLKEQESNLRKLQAAHQAKEEAVTPEPAALPEETPAIAEAGYAPNIQELRDWYQDAIITSSDPTALQATHQKIQGYVDQLNDTKTATLTEADYQQMTAAIVESEKSRTESPGMVFSRNDFIAQKVRNQREGDKVKDSETADRRMPTLQGGNAVKSKSGQAER